VGSVVGLWRYPLKSGAGESLDTATIRSDGLLGDRRWAVADEDGVLVSAKHPRRGGPLLQVRARYDDTDQVTTLETPGQSTVVAGSAEADIALSALLGRSVHLRSEVAPDLQLTRRWPELQELVPEWEPSAQAGADAVTTVAAGGRLDSFVDFGPVHIVTTADLAVLSATTASAVNPLRFRPNVLIDGVAELQPGMRLQIGDVVLRVELPTPRCVVPGLAQLGVTEDLSVLTAVARQPRKQVATLGRAACLGVYARGEGTGTLRMGDQALFR
jgi:uncharacterized protein YcbX